MIAHAVGDSHALFRCSRQHIRFRECIPFPAERFSYTLSVSAAQRLYALSYPRYVVILGYDERNHRLEEILP